MKALETGAYRALGDNQASMNTLAEWLAHCERLHPAGIELGLDRVRAVADRLNLRFDCPVITVAGTNGKGSTCAMLERILLAAGYRVGLYTSPHLLQYNERVRIDGVAAEYHQLRHLRLLRDGRCAPSS